MLNRKTPETLAITLTIKSPAQGDQVTCEVVYYNRTQAQIDAYDKSLRVTEEGKEPRSLEEMGTALFLYVVKSVDGITPTPENVAEMEDAWPGSSFGIYLKFAEARRCEVVKN